jgi:hypothetical protein
LGYFAEGIVSFVPVIEGGIEFPLVSVFGGSFCFGALEFNAVGGMVDGERGINATEEDESVSFPEGVVPLGEGFEVVLFVLAEGGSYLHMYACVLKIEVSYW